MLGEPASDAPPELTIGIEGVAAAAQAVLPTLQFRARLRSTGRDPVRSVSLETHIRIATDRGSYCEEDQRRLADLFGGPVGVSRPRPSLLWARANTQVPEFAGETRVEIPVICTYDFEVVAARFLHALTGGEVPLEFWFSGAVFYGVDGQLRAWRLPPETEASFRMPVRVWRELMEQYFPGTAWLRLDRDVFEALTAYRAQRTLTSWTETVRSLLHAAGAA
jgi:hypothetical protein